MPRGAHRQISERLTNARHPNCWVSYALVYARWVQIIHTEDCDRQARSQWIVLASRKTQRGLRSIRCIFHAITTLMRDSVPHRLMRGAFDVWGGYARWGPTWRVELPLPIAAAVGQKATPFCISGYSGNGSIASHNDRHRRRTCLHEFAEQRAIGWGAAAPCVTTRRSTLPSDKWPLMF